LNIALQPQPHVFFSFRQELKQDPVLLGEGVAGAFYWRDFLDTARRAGFTDPRLVQRGRITIKNA
jgi:arsenite methyltransferase